MAVLERLSVRGFKSLRALEEFELRATGSDLTGPLVAGRGAGSNAHIP